MKIHIFHTGSVCVSPHLPFGGDDCNILKASGIFTRKSRRLWLPVSAYLIEHSEGKILVDCGWHRDISPEGVFDRGAQIRSLGSPILYLVNQGVVGKGMAIDEQLARHGVRPSDLDYVLCTHLDCDHVNGLRLVADARRIMVASDELQYAERHPFIRFQKRWWRGVRLTPFDWNAGEGPFGKSYDLLSDGSITLINIAGHSNGLFAVKVTNREGKYVLLASDGGYSTRSWQELIPSGIALDRQKQMQSLRWIKSQSEHPDCIASIANHDPDVSPHTIEL